MQNTIKSYSKKLDDSQTGHVPGREDNPHTDVPLENETVDEFLRAVSHDLKAPLRRIAQFTAILMAEHSEKLDDEGKRVVNVITNNVKTMEVLLTGLMAISQLSRQELHYAEIDMALIAKHAYEELANRAPERSIKFILNEMPRAYCDQHLIRELFNRLLDNAIKFTCGVEHAVIEAGGYSNDIETVYYIKDNGAGFDMNYSNKLFRTFQKLHGPGEFAGAGVGLSIVRLIARRHRGRVWAEGKPGNGAIFYFTIPVKPMGESS